MSSTLPAGEVAITVHRGQYADLGLPTKPSPSGAPGAGGGGPIRREVYGPHRDDPAELTTEVHWLLSKP